MDFVHTITGGNIFLFVGCKGSEKTTLMHVFSLVMQSEDEVTR